MKDNFNKKGYKLIIGAFLGISIVIICFWVKYSGVTDILMAATRESIILSYSPTLDYVDKEGQVQEPMAASVMAMINPSYEFYERNAGENASLEGAVTVAAEVADNNEDSSDAKDTNDSTKVSAFPVIIEYGKSEETNEKTQTNENQEVSEAEKEESKQSAETSRQENAKKSMTEPVSGIIYNSVMNGNVYSRAELNRYDFTRGFYIVPSHTDLPDSILKPQDFLDRNMAIHQDNSVPQVLIYHTHSQESFADSDGTDATSIVGVGDYLTKLLEEEYGYNVIHDRSVYDLIDGKLDRSNAYVLSANGANEILAANPTIEIIIDLHRDGVDESTRLVTQIDGKDVAKVMFFNGISYSNEQGEIDYLENPFRDGNLACSLQAYLLGEAYFPGFLRKNYINAYRYNFHIREKALLIEAGAQNNTVQEVMNAMEPLAQILDRLLKGEKAY